MNHTAALASAMFIIGNYIIYDAWRGGHLWSSLVTNTYYLLYYTEQVFFALNRKLYRSVTVSPNVIMFALFQIVFMVLYMVISKLESFNDEFEDIENLWVFKIGTLAVQVDQFKQLIRKIENLNKLSDSFPLHANSLALQLFELKDDIELARSLHIRSIRRKRPKSARRVLPLRKRNNVRFATDNEYGFGLSNSDISDASSAPSELRRRLRRSLMKQAQMIRGKPSARGCGDRPDVNMVSPEKLIVTHSTQTSDRNLIPRKALDLFPTRSPAGLPPPPDTWVRSLYSNPMSENVRPRSPATGAGDVKVYQLSVVDYDLESSPSVSDTEQEFIKHVSAVDLGEARIMYVRSNVDEGRLNKLPCISEHTETSDSSAR